MSRVRDWAGGDAVLSRSQVAHPVFGMLGHRIAARRLRRPTIARAQHSAPCPPRQRHHHRQLRDAQYEPVDSLKLRRPISLESIQNSQSPICMYSEYDSLCPPAGAPRGRRPGARGRARGGPPPGGGGGAGGARARSEEVPHGSCSGAGGAPCRGLRRLLAAACASVPVSLSVSGCISVDGRPLL